jgi:hypothetical protein
VVFKRCNNMFTTGDLEMNINIDEIEFEVHLEDIDGVSNAVPDMMITKTGSDKIITTNFNSQSLRYFQEIADVQDLRIFRRADVQLTKQQVINSWKSSGILGNVKVKKLFEKYDEDIVKSGFDSDTESLEDFLKNDDHWFDTIFNSPFEK